MPKKLPPRVKGDVPHGFVRITVSLSPEVWHQLENCRHQKALDRSKAVSQAILCWIAVIKKGGKA